MRRFTRNASELEDSFHLLEGSLHLLEGPLHLLEGSLHLRRAAPSAAEYAFGMGPWDLVRLPLTGARLTLRALEDLNALAENARGRVDIADELMRRLDALAAQAAALTATALTLDLHAAEIVSGGKDLVAVARSLDETLLVFRAQLPRLLGALDTVEELEGAAETVADTLEPLQGAAERVGRMTKRLSRS